MIWPSKGGFTPSSLDLSQVRSPVISSARIGIATKKRQQMKHVQKMTVYSHR
jgi:hypothetical protein